MRVESKGGCLFKFSEYPFKQNKNMLKNMTVLLYTNFYDISLNVLRPTLLNLYNLPILRSPNIGKINVNVGPKAEYFSDILSSYTNRIGVFNNFFSLICSQPRDKENCSRDFLLSKYFLNNLLLTVSMQNTLSKLVELFIAIKINNSLLGKIRARFCAASCYKCVCKV